MKKVDGEVRADPVCLFPPRGSNKYSSNPNLKIIQSNRIYPWRRKVIGGQPDTDLNLKSILFDSGDTSKLWEEIHNLEEYGDTLERICG